jgi:penicillin-binding protein-related factor A (putative recombinase)
MNSHANRGRGLEAVVIASQMSVIAIEKMPTGAKYIGGEWRPIASPVDYVGTVCGRGLAIVFDAKQCLLSVSFNVGNRDHFPEHQRQFLMRQRDAGAIAGVLVEATHPKVAAYFWLDAIHLRQQIPSIRWDDPMFVRLGPSNRIINFRNVPGVTPEQKVRSSCPQR